MDRQVDIGDVETHRRGVMFSESEDDGFFGKMINGGAIRLFQVVLIFFLCVYLIVNIHQFLVFAAQEEGEIDYARQRFEINCVNQNANTARLFFNDCNTDRVNKDKSAYWEALYRMARKQRICGESDCSGAVYFMAGLIMGCILLILLLPKIQRLCMYGVTKINEAQMAPYDSDSSSWFPFRNSEGKKWK